MSRPSPNGSRPISTTSPVFSPPRSPLPHLRPAATSTRSLDPFRFRGTETTISRWIEQLDGSGKTISKATGFSSGAFNAAVRAGVMASNPCRARLQHIRVEEQAL